LHKGLIFPEIEGVRRRRHAVFDGFGQTALHGNLAFDNAGAGVAPSFSGSNRYFWIILRIPTTLAGHQLWRGQIMLFGSGEFSPLQA
jgi:hypothetical protein